MTTFASAFCSNDSTKKLNTEELIRALRLMIASELEAANMYEQLAENIDNNAIKGILKSVADEEIVHVGEFKAALDLLRPAEMELCKKGIKEASKIKATDEEVKTETETETETEEPVVKKKLVLKVR